MKNEINENKALSQTSVMVSADFQKYNFHNTGTPQEMIDEDNYWNPQTEQEKNFGCLVSILFFIVVVLIFKYLL